MSKVHRVGSFTCFDAVSRSNASGISFVNDPGMTDQSFKDECDINNMLSRGTNSLLAAHYNQVQGNYGDFTGVVDYHTAFNQVQEANEMFMTLPAAVRTKFDNDAGKFLSFATDEANIDQMIDLGLAKPEIVKRSPQANSVPQGEGVVDSPNKST